MLIEQRLEMSSIDFEKLKKDLHEGECIVTFTKSDGTERKLRCTLQESKLPPVKDSEKPAEKVRKINTDIMSVWDLEKNAWRSFRKDSVISVK